MNPTGKVALITGGAHRVGKAITMMLAEAGASVVVNYNASAQAADETVCEVKALGVDGLAVQCDVSDWDAVQRMTDAIHERFGGVDIIVNGASYFGKIDFPSQEPDTIEMWKRVTRVSLDGAFYVCTSLVPSMLERAERDQREGVIVNIIDLSVWFPWPKFMAHAVGKSGLQALTRQMALELAPTVRVNAVAPGPVLPLPEYGEKTLKYIADGTLLDRWGSPEDVAKAVRYLVEAEYVTGDILTVDGGERFGQNKPRKKK